MTTLKMISDRVNFWDVDAVSKATAIEEVDEAGKTVRDNVSLSELQGKRILMLIHGFNEPKPDLLSNYFLIQGKVQKLLVDPQGKPFYDEVVGYAWPGCGKPVDYFSAERNAGETSDKLDELLDQMDNQGTRLDIIAHSMGNRLLLEALERADAARPVKHFFSMGAAVGDESIEREKMFGGSVEKCERVFVIYSKNDPVLEYAYLAAERDVALGSEGVEDISKLSHRVELVDSSDVVKEHSGYFKADQVYQFIKDSLLSSNSWLPKYAKAVKLLPSGETITVKHSTPFIYTAAKVACVAVCLTAAIYPLYYTLAGQQQQV